MSKLLIAGFLLLLLMGAGYGITQAARAIPWDCSDWQAFAHEDRTTAILESLAENRGKTLYCGVDQSDTFAKAETWQAGKDRNERDDTIYSGERGIFRGFIAAQEGWLTEGESGVTGVSIDRIFEFPREKKKRRRREPRLLLRYDREYPTSTLPNPGLMPSQNPGGPLTGYLVVNQSFPPNFIRGPRITENALVRAFGPQGTGGTDNAAAQASARSVWAVTADQAAEWARNGNEETSWSTLEVAGGATEECQSLGWNRATNVRWWYYDLDGDGNPLLVLGPNEHETTGSYQYRAYAQIFYEATCRK